MRTPQFKRLKQFYFMDILKTEVHTKSQNKNDDSCSKFSFK